MTEQEIKARVEALTADQASDIESECYTLAMRSSRRSDGWNARLAKLIEIVIPAAPASPNFELAALKARVEQLETALHKIGDLAHDHSTGPAVPDGYWEIRSLAYDA